MLSLLFDKNFWYIMLILACIVGLLIVYIKFPTGRIFINSLVLIVVFGFTVYAGYYVNSYYSSSGGIYGQITSLFRTEVSIDELEFTFTNIELTQELSSSTYSMSQYTNGQVSVDKDKTYHVYVNGKACTYQLVTEDYCKAEFGFVFYDTNDNILYSDTLYISFSFNTNQSYLYVCTKGGATAVTYWNQYFERNGFIVTLEEYNGSQNLQYGIGEVDIQYTVSYTYNDQTIMQELYVENDSLTLPNIVAVYEWTLEDGTAVSSGYKVNENTTLYASMYTDIEQGMIYQDGQTFTLVEFDNGTLIGSAVAYSGLVWLDAGTNDYTFISTEGYGWTGCSKFGNYCLLTSFYADIEDIYFNSKTLSLFDLDVSMNHSMFVDLSDGYIVYTTENVEGVFLLSMADMSSTKIVESGTWTSFSTKYNEITGLWSTVLIYGSEDYHYSYDIITKTLTTYSEDEVVGF